VGCYDDDKSPKVALDMFHLRTFRVWCHAAISTSSDLNVDRSRKLVGLQSPEACATRAGGDFCHNFENYDLFHAKSPDTGTPDAAFAPVGGGRTKTPTPDTDTDVVRYFLG